VRQSSSASRWTVAFGYHRDRAPNHGYAATRKKEDFSSDCFGVDLAAANAELRSVGVQVRESKALRAINPIVQGG
jgi:hypothetical protein